MDFAISKRLIFFVLMILSFVIYIFNNGSDDKVKKSSITHNDKVDKVQTNSVVVIKKPPSELQKKILVEKQKILDANILQKNILNTRKEYLLNQSQQRSKYLSNKARYSSESLQRVEKKIKSIKTEKEKQHRKNYEQYIAGKHFEQRNQVHKRTALDHSRQKALSSMQDKQLLHEKYTKEE
ncbi:MAG: hypothetical protein U9P72_06340 [Campylobacterota bacterium]|nr:hypothetical protein [Campylobacterota bacterium]